MNTLTLKDQKMQELSINELQTIDGGGVPAWLLTASAYAAAGVTGVGIVVVGAAVGYGIYSVLNP